MCIPYVLLSCVLALLIPLIMASAVLWSCACLMHMLMYIHIKPVRKPTPTSGNRRHLYSSQSSCPCSYPIVSACSCASPILLTHPTVYPLCALSVTIPCVYFYLVLYEYVYVYEYARHQPAATADCRRSGLSTEGQCHGLYA